MVATIGKMAASSYYTDSQESQKPASDYYAAGEEPDGRWYDPAGLLQGLAAGAGAGNASANAGSGTAGAADQSRGGPPAADVRRQGGSGEPDGPAARPSIFSPGHAGEPENGQPQADDLEARAAADSEKTGAPLITDVPPRALQDSARIDSVSFHRLYNGFAPDGTRLVQNAGSDRRASGIDLTFSADKSVSALWALADPKTREEIEAAQAAAVRAALDEVILPNCSFTRIRNSETKEIELKAADIFCATFQHGSSREKDPQLHTHCTFFNLARTREDGKWRALYRGRPFFRWKMAAGAVYRMALAKNLEDRLGIEMERYGRDGAFTRVAGMPEELEQAWSKRRQQMLSAAGEQGWSIAGNAERAASLNLVTRASKRSRSDGSAGRLARWFVEAREVVENIDEIVESLVGNEREVTQERLRELTEALEAVPGKLTREEAVFLLPDVYERVANACAGVCGIDAFRTAVERVLHSDQVEELDRREASIDAAEGLAHTRIYTTKETIQAEETVQELARSMVADERFAVPEEAVDASVVALLKEGYPLSAEQIVALRQATSAGRVAIIEGAAGSGKTTTLRPLVDLYKAQGCRVIGAAVAWRVAVALGTECDIEPRSVTQLLKRAERGTLVINDRTVIVVDEASLLSTRQMRRIQELSERHGVKIVLCGDTQQQQAVEAGPGLRLVRDVAGSAVVAQIRRQKADLEDIWRSTEGMDKETARLRAGLVSPAERAQIVDEFEALPAAERAEVVPWQVTASEALRDCNAAAAIKAYHERGKFHIERDLAATLTSLVDDWARFRKQNSDKSVVVLARTHREIDALSYMMRERALAEQNDPARVVVETCQGREDDRRTSPLEIAKGDLLRIGATVWEKRLYNGTVVTVEDFRKDGTNPETGQERVLIRGLDEHGRAVEFHHDEVRDWFGNVRLKHGYALTITSAQGMTVDQSFVLADDRPARETIYPAATRHREGLDIYVNREPIAGDIASRRPEDESDAPVEDADIRDHLAKAWSRSRPKVAAHDHMSAEMRERWRREAREAKEASREADPDSRTAADWLVANDNADGELRTVANGMRYADLDVRHGQAVAAFAGEAAKISRTWGEYRARSSSGEGAAVAQEPAFGAALRQHKALLETAEAWRDPKFTALLERRGGLGPGAIENFEQEYEAASRFRRSVLATEARRAQNQKRTARTDAPQLSETATPRETSRAAQKGEAVAHTPMREQLPAPRELAAVLAQRAEEVCRRYLPNGARSGGYWHAGSVAGEKGQSLYVHLTGRRAGRWQDAATGEYGDLLDLVQLNRGYLRLGDAMREAADFLGGWLTVPVEAPPPAPERTPAEAEAERERLEKFFASGRRILHDDPAGRHLRSRGLDPQLADGLRYHPAAWVKVGEESRRLPAILLPVRTADGRLEAVHRIFITEDGGPAEIRGRKRNSGSPREGGVWFGNRGASRVVICEGAEDALAIYGALTPEERERIAVVASLSSGRIPAVRLPATARELILVRDRDAAGERSWDALQERHAGSDLALACIVPELKDANAVLTERGAAALRGNLAIVTAGEAVERDAVLYQRAPVGEGPDGDDIWRRLGETPRVREAVESAIREEMEKLGVGGVRLRIVDTIEDAAAGSYADNLIRLALAPREEMLGTLRHEVIHALRDFGAFTAREWAVLADRAEREWLDAGIRESYAELSDDKLIEEAIAEGYRKWYLGEVEVDGAAKPLLERISRLIEAVRNAVLGRGWRTAEDIFRAIEHGEIAGVVRRPDVSGKDPIPVVEVSSRFADVPLGRARRTVRAWALGNIRGVYRNVDTGWDIQISRLGIRESTGKGALKRHDLEILAVVPDLLRSAVRYESEPDKEELPQVRAYHHLVGAVKLDGEIKRVRLTVREDLTGRRFFDHCTIGGVDPEVFSRADQGRTLSSIASPTGSTITMAELFDGAKYRDRMTVLAPVSGLDAPDISAGGDDQVQYRKAGSTPSKEAFLDAFRKVVSEHVGREREAPGKAEETPSREAFLSAYRTVVADHVGERKQGPAAAPSAPSPAPDEGGRAEPAVRETNAAKQAAAEAAAVFAEFQDDWSAHVAGARGLIAGHPFYADGYGDLHRRMDALAALPDLPDDARAFVSARLAEHGGLVEADRRVEKLQASVEKMLRDRGVFYKLGELLGKPPREIANYDRWHKDSEAVIAEGKRVLADPACAAALGKTIGREIRIASGLQRLSDEHQFEDRARVAEEKRCQEAAAPAEKERQMEPEEERAREHTHQRDQSRGRGMSM